MDAQKIILPTLVTTEVCVCEGSSKETADITVPLIRKVSYCA